MIRCFRERWSLEEGLAGARRGLEHDQQTDWPPTH